METKQGAGKLFQKFLNNECSAAEIEQLLGYFHTDRITMLNELILEELEKPEDAVLTAPPIEVYQGIQNRIHKVAIGSVRSLWYKLGITAALAAITLGVWSYYTYRHSVEGRNPGRIQYAKDIKPGGNKATITLANGEVIDLNAQKSSVVIGAEGMTYSDGDSLQNGVYTNVQTLTASTPRGGMYDFVLPDGSKVFLNAATTVKFPSVFDKKNRVIELVSGEAYFEVAKEKKRPFIVKSAGQQVEVLGTHFNINAYADEPLIRTTLLEGSVKVSNTAESFAPQMLQPGQQAMLQGTRLNVINVDVDAVIDWKNGEFIFDNESLESLMRKVARWYDIHIEYADQEAKGVIYYGSISRFENVSKVLSKFEQTGEVRFKVDKNKITVYKNR